MLRFLVLLELVMVLGTASCNQMSTGERHTSTFQARRAVVQAIRRQFPGAQTYKRATDSILTILAGIGIRPVDILWGQSVCVDDITNTKDKMTHAEISGPFTLSGLAGLPFTGVTGLSALAEHVPEDGTAVISVEPHIGFSEERGWGTILRPGHQHASSCCGALSAALDKLKKGAIVESALQPEDYQEQVIEQVALRHKAVLSAPEPLVVLTLVTCAEAERMMREYAGKLKVSGFKYAVLVTGVIINTDYQYPDFMWVKNVTIITMREKSVGGPAPGR